jgi:hypothetical protein
MTGFEHLLLTRFNVTHHTLDKHGKRVNTDQWMDHRFKLFETFCLPSVAGQSETNFQWLVFFHRDTPAKHRSRIDSYRELFHFVPVYIGDESELVRMVLDHVAGHVRQLITTRLDTDDAIHKDMIAAVQAAFQEQANEFVNPLYGYTYDLGDNSIYETRVESNPFISLIESRRADGARPFNTVWSVRHTQAAERGPIRNITKQPYWLQVVHDRNVINAVKSQNPPSVITSTKQLLKKMAFRAGLIKTYRGPGQRKTKLKIQDLPAFGVKLPNLEQLAVRV